MLQNKPEKYRRPTSFYELIEASIPQKEYDRFTKIKEAWN